MRPRNTDPQALTARRLSVAAHHVGGGPGLVDEDVALGIKIKLTVETCLPPLQDDRALLLCRFGSLYIALDAVPSEETLNGAAETSFCSSRIRKGATSPAGIGSL